MQTDTRVGATKPMAERTPVFTDQLHRAATTRQARKMLGIFEKIDKEADSLSEKTAEQRRLEAMGMRAEARNRAAVMKDPDKAKNLIDSVSTKAEGGPNSSFVLETVTQLNEYVLGGMTGNDQLNWLITQVAREAVRENLPPDFLMKYPEPLRSEIALRMGH